MLRRADDESDLATRPRSLLKVLGVSISVLVVLFAAGLVFLWAQDFKLGASDGRDDAVSDWAEADSMAGLFDVVWPESARNVYFASDVWFHFAYEVRIDMGPTDASALLASVPDCEPVNEIPTGFINKDWWQVAEAESWTGCQTDASIGWWNWIVVDNSNDDAATVYLAHFQPDS